MEEKLLLNLATHISHLSQSLIQQIDREGIIRSYISENEAVPDLAASYHLVDLCVKLDTNLFAPLLRSLVGWMINPDNGVVHEPFTLDSLVSVTGVKDDTTQLLRDSIANSQLPNGGFDKFCAYVRGGDYFSTLWCVKILSKYSNEEFKTEIHDAVKYLIDNKAIAEQQINHLGYLALILLKSDIEEFEEETGNVLNKLFNMAKDINTESNLDLLLVDEFFVLEDLLEWYENEKNEDVLEFVENRIKYIYNLENEAEELPEALTKEKSRCAESLFLQTIARGNVVCLKYLYLKGINNIGQNVHQLFFDDYRVTRYKALENHRNLKQFLEKYGKIHEQFVEYNEALEIAWQQSPPEKTIFLIMPFKNTTNYRVLTEKIKEVCKENDYKAIRVDDNDRQFKPTLWDNLIVNMLSAKFAIAIYINDQVIDRIKDENRLFANPNVALEFGWFQSRGQETLILKDKNSILPTDLQGFLWDQFDIENPDTTIEKPLKKWFERIV